MPSYTYECNQCGEMFQSATKIKCPCGCGQEDHFECTCGGIIHLKCICMRGQCGAFKGDIIYDMDDSIDEMTEN